MARYLVTGATGFVGAEVAKQLRSRGHQVVALVRDPGRASLLRTLGTELHQGDITDRASLRAPMQGVDGVFHVAAWYKTGQPGTAALATAVNVEGTRNVLETMRELGIPRGVYTSTLAVNSDTRGAVVDESYFWGGPHLTVYDHSKWRAHYEVALPMMAQGLPLVVVMPGAVYGPGDTSALRAVFIDHIRRRLPFVPSGTAFCWGHIEDTARAHIEAMERGRPGQVYIVAGPPHTLLEAVQTAARFSGRRPPIAIPPGLLRGASHLARVVEGMVTLPTALSSETLRLLGGVTYLGAHDKARRELGFAPRPLAEGMRHLVEHEMRMLGLTPPSQA